MAGRRARRRSRRLQAHRHKSKKKPTWENIERCSPTSAYSITNLPAGPGCPSPSHPTTVTTDYMVRSGECKRLATPVVSGFGKCKWAFIHLLVLVAGTAFGARTLASDAQPHTVCVKTEAQ
jgi:hypothetical protein